MKGDLGERILRGAGGGAAATLVMTAAMLAAQRLGLMGKLPPERITEQTLDRAGVRRSARTDRVLATASHFAYGAGCGALFALLRGGTRDRLPTPLKGAIFGAAVWGVSYAGWLPATGLMPPPHRDRRHRPASMVVAHLVYGATLGALV